MSEQWVNQSKNILEIIGKLSAKEDRDRLELINIMIFALNAADHSIHGWRSWIQNLGFMSRFTEEELKDIEESLLKLIRSFVEYDIEITQKHQNKIPRSEFTVSRRQETSSSRSMYT